MYQPYHQRLAAVHQIAGQTGPSTRPDQRRLRGARSMQRHRVLHRGEPRRDTTGSFPKTDGTYRAVVAKAREHGARVPEFELAKWIEEGTADMRAGNDETACARFTRKFEELKRDWRGSYRGSLDVSSDGECRLF